MTSHSGNQGNKREFKYDLSDPEAYQRFWEQEVDFEKDPLAMQAMQKVDFKTKTGMFTHQRLFKTEKEAIDQMN